MSLSPRSHVVEGNINAIVVADQVSRALRSTAEPRPGQRVYEHSRKKFTQSVRKALHAVVGSVFPCSLHGLLALGIGLQYASAARRPPLSMLCSSAAGIGFQYGSAARRPPLGMLCSIAALWSHGMHCNSAALLTLFGVAVPARHPAVL